MHSYTNYSTQIIFEEEKVCHHAPSSVAESPMNGTSSEFFLCYMQNILSVREDCKPTTPPYTKAPPLSSQPSQPLFIDTRTKTILSGLCFLSFPPRYRCLRSCRWCQLSEIGVAEVALEDLHLRWQTATRCARLRTSATEGRS